MNENLNLIKILKDCPKGTTLYSIAYGNVRVEKILPQAKQHPIIVRIDEYVTESFSADGKMYFGYDGECAIFPSRDQRDWSKFTAPWYKKERFDPKTLQPFDKVLVRDENSYWRCNLFSHITNHKFFPYVTVEDTYSHCIPYNDDTKHLVGTNEEAPEFYRYWEE